MRLEVFGYEDECTEYRKDDHMSTQVFEKLRKSTDRLEKVFEAFC